MDLLPIFFTSKVHFFLKEQPPQDAENGDDMMHFIHKLAQVGIDIQQYCHVYNNINFHRFELSLNLTDH